MPEGDTVYLAARRLDAAFAGARIERCEFKIPALATCDLTRLTVQGVHSYGKHLLFRFDDDRTLHTHFRMDGTWHLYRPGDRWRGGPLHEVRLVLGTSERVAVGYRLHDVAVVPTKREGDLIGHLGPDILAGDFARDVVIERMRAHPSMTVGSALVDQRHVAGIGNIYRTEAMFISGVDPRTLVVDLDDKALAHCVDIARILMVRNKDRGSQSTTGDERRAHHVYGRVGRACRRCGTRIVAARLGELHPDRGAANEQLVAWCPTCQPAGAGQVARD